MYQAIHTDLIILQLTIQISIDILCTYPYIHVYAYMRATRVPITPPPQTNSCRGTILSSMDGMLQGPRFRVRVCKIKKQRKILTGLFSVGDNNIRITANCVANYQVDSFADSNPQKTHQILHFPRRN